MNDERKIHTSYFVLHTFYLPLLKPFITPRSEV